jgi:membrane protease YdiL (CAAX protease family)
MQEFQSALLRVLPFVVVPVIFRMRIKQGKLDGAALGIQTPDSPAKYLYWCFGYLSFVLLTEYMLYRNGVLIVSKWNHPLGPSMIRIVGAVVLAPLAEELMFRGAILNLLMKKMRVPFAIVLQALLFVVAHAFTYQNTLESNIGIMQGLVDATLFAYARLSTNSIYTSMTMHATGNLVATAERFVF